MKLCRYFFAFLVSTLPVHYLLCYCINYFWSLVVSVHIQTIMAVYEIRMRVEMGQSFVLIPYINTAVIKLLVKFLVTYGNPASTCEQCGPTVTIQTSLRGVHQLPHYLILNHFAHLLWADTHHNLFTWLKTSLVKTG